MKKRSIRQLAKEMTLKEYEDFCLELATEYADTDYEFAKSYFCTKYNISQACYYKCLEYAVVNNLVDDIAVTGIMHKSAYNQNAYFKKKEEEEGNVTDKRIGGTSLAKYNRLYEERCILITNSFSEDEVDEIATAYAIEKRSSKYKLSVKYEVSTRVIDYSIERALKEDRLSPEIRAAVRLKLEKETKKTRPIKFKEA